MSEKAKQALNPGRKPSDALYDVSRAREIVLTYLQPATDFQDYETWLMVGMVQRQISFAIGEEDYLFDTWDKWPELMDNYYGEEALYKTEQASIKIVKGAHMDSGLYTSSRRQIATIKVVRRPRLDSLNHCLKAKRRP